MAKTKQKAKGDAAPNQDLNSILQLGLKAQVLGLDRLADYDRMASVAEDEFCVKTWSENEVLVAPMLATGLFEDAGRRVPSGHVVAPVWRIKDPANVPPIPGRRSGSDRTAAMASAC